MDEQNKNAANEANEAADLRKNAILDELRQVNNRLLKYAIQEEVAMRRLTVELCLKALTGDFTGFRVVGENGVILAARYAYTTDDTYSLTGIDIVDTRSESRASGIAGAIIGDLRLHHAISAALRNYELAAALYRA